MKTKQKEVMTAEREEEHFTTHEGDMIVEQMGRAILTIKGPFTYWFVIAPDGACASGRLRGTDSHIAKLATQRAQDEVRSLANNRNALTAIIWVGDKP